MNQKESRNHYGNRLVTFWCPLHTLWVKLILILKPSDTARVQDVTDSESATVLVVERLNVRSAGRGRGRKGVTAKETMQVHVQWCK